MTQGKQQVHNGRGRHKIGENGRHLQRATSCSGWTKPPSSQLLVMEAMHDDSWFKELHNRQQCAEALRNLNIILMSGNDQRKAEKRLASSACTVNALIHLLNSKWPYSDGNQNSSELIDTANSVDLGQDARGKECKNLDPSLAVLALNCIYNICDHPSFLDPKCVEKCFVSTLLRYVIPDPALSEKPSNPNRFFQFGPTYTTYVKNILLSKNCNGLVNVLFDKNCVPEDKPKKTSDDANTDSGLQEWFHSELQFYEPLFPPKSVEIRSCHIHIPAGIGYEEVDLATYLISQGMAWPQGDNVTEITEAARKKKYKHMKATTNHSEYMQAKITHLSKGNFLWMIVGKEKIKKAEQVAKILNDYAAHLINFMPQKLGAVVAKVTTEDSQVFVRARVLDISGVVLTVQDVDTGCVHHVSLCNIYKLAPSLNFTSIPPLAVLTCLDGLLPPPLDARAPELAAGALGLIVRNSNILAVNLMLQSAVLLALPGLVMCPDPEVAYRTLDLVVNLLSYRIQKVRASPWHCLIPGALATLRQCMERTIMNRATVSKSSTYPEADGSGLSSPQSSPSDGSTESLNLSTARTCLSNRRNAALVESCIACLANCMFMSPKGKAVFYQSNGLETVIQAFVIYYNDSSIRKLCLSALANYVYFNKPTNPCIRNYRYQSLRKTSPLSKPGSQESNSGDMKGESNSESDGSESQGEEDFSISGTLTESFSSVESYRSSSFTSDEGQGGENSQKKFYVRGSKALFSQDATHELQASAKPEDFVALICGMLNTGRTGTIYLGLDPKDSSVLGVSMDHDARDEMRMSIDHLMVERLSPSVLHLQFHVEFIPVVEVPMRESEQDVTASVEDNNNEGGKNDKASPAVFHLDHDFVVEIQLKPLPSVIYCCNGNECFYRLGPQTVVLDPQLIRQLLVLEEEAEHAEQIATLQQELRRLKTQVAQLHSSPSLGGCYS